MDNVFSKTEGKRAEGYRQHTKHMCKKDMRLKKDTPENFLVLDSRIFGLRRRKHWGSRQIIGIEDLDQAESVETIEVVRDLIAKRFEYVINQVYFICSRIVTNDHVFVGWRIQFGIDHRFIFQNEIIN